MFEKKNKSDMMSEQEAIDLLKSWGEMLDADIDNEEFQDVIDELKGSVRKKNLVFDPDSETFKYKLLSPIEKKDAEKINLVTISEMNMESKRSVQNYKENQAIDKAIALMSTSLDIENGFASRIKDRDAGRINAVILGFFVQVRRS